MSIAALKKKSRRFIDPISANNTGFSLNSNRRNISYIGPVNLGSYTNKHGAAYCDNTINSEINRSVMNTRGMLASKFICSNSDGKCYKEIVTPMGPHHFSQSEFLKNKSIHSLVVRDISYNFDAGISICCNEKNGNNNWLTSRPQSTYAKEIKVATSYDQYMKDKLMRKNCLPPRCAVQKHFPVYVNNNGCNPNITTMTNAISLGYIKDNCC